MTLDERPDGTILVRYDSTRLTVVMLALSGVFVLVAVYDVSLGTRGTERLIGLLASAATCFLTGIVFLERAWFEFSAATRLVTWRRRWALQLRSGSTPFDAIQSVLVERPMGDQGTPSRRVTLRTRTGEEIPITVGYRPDGDDLVVRIADRIRRVLGHDAAMTPTQQVKALLAARRTVDAIRLVREAEGLTLAEAKRRIEDLSK
jgi:hypothetical protein